MSKSLPKDEIESEPTCSYYQIYRKSQALIQSWLKSFSRWQYKFSKLWVVTKSLGFKAQACMLWLGKQRGEKWGVTGRTVTGNISGWLLNWKQDTFLDTVFIMDVRTGPYLHSQSTQYWVLTFSFPICPPFSFSINFTKIIIRCKRGMYACNYSLILQYFVRRIISVNSRMQAISQTLYRSVSVHGPTPLPWRHLLSLLPVWCRQTWIWRHFDTREIRLVCLKIWYYFFHTHFRYLIELNLNSEKTVSIFLFSQISQWRMEVNKI